MEKINTRPIIIGKVGAQNIYEVTEDELIALEKNSEDSLYLNFALVLLTSALSTLVSYLFIDSSDLSIPTLCFLYCIIGIGFFGGSFLMILWNNKRAYKTKVLRRVRERIEKIELKSLE